MKLPIHALAAAALLLQGCLSAEDDNDAAPDDLLGASLSLGVQSDSEISVELLAAAPLHVGLNQVYYRIKRVADDTLVTAATLTQNPMMNMTTMAMEHSCPHEGPAASANAEGVFAAKVVFIMATSSMGTSAGAWRLELGVDLNNGSSVHDLVFHDLEVAESSARKELALTGGMGGSEQVIVTLNFGRDLAVGQNPFTLTAHKKTQMGMVWVPMTDWAITVTPDMPSMGHGSPGNVSPTHVDAGRYDGSVNLTMGGVWRITFDFADAMGTDLGEVEYEVEL